MKVFFVGGGNIARIVLKELGSCIDSCWYYDKVETGLECKYLSSFYIPSDCDVVVECASTEAVREFGLEVLESGKDLYVMSSGAFADEEFFKRFSEKLSTSKSNVYIPSGAIGGLDIIYAIRNYINSVKITTRKPPKAFGLEELSTQRTIFYGKVVDAIKQFPQNANVSITLSLAVGDFEKVFVEIVADPKIEQNIHEINISSSVGEYTIIHKNKPSPNPKTSYLAPLSLAAELKKRFEKLKI
ncbi:MAG: aspartate dehydrogenase [Fervidobacterium sp.]|nr:aspartate dehydrogenase [Fervidobacterium sp.]